ncbi:MAG: glycosyltransferase family 9 protein [Armatimonadota bacterium]|nr:glycosyltransferase family 9 protein [Armatimonadota bacterium]
MAYPAIKRAIELVGEENVYFWVFEENRPVLDLIDIIPPENIFTVRTNNILSFLFDILRTLYRIRRVGIDSTIDMEFFTRAPAILSYLTGASRRVGMHRFTSETPYRGNLMTHRIQYNPYQHTAITYYLLVEALTRDESETPMIKSVPMGIDLSPPVFNATEDERIKMQDTLDKIAGRNVEPPIVLLNPNSSDLIPIRRWPTEYFVDLGKRILAEYPEVTLVITGSPNEQNSALELIRKIGSNMVINMAGKTTLRELLVLYSIADILVTNDSGPVHFASLTDIKSICLFGPETPILYGPLGNRAHIVSAGLACSPCVNVYNHRFSPCQDNLCMKEITVEKVYAIVSKLISEVIAKKRRTEHSSREKQLQ